MRWEQLTYPDFAGAVETCGGVGIVPVGVIEPHGAHLPLGTDMFASHWTACRAAEEEPAIVFPMYPWGINHEGAHLPGSVVIKRELVFALLEGVCDEMGRQGVTRIILLSGHGGNRYFLPLLVQTLSEKECPYCVYYASLPSFEGRDELLESGEYGHACEAETSDMLHIAPELVKMDSVPEEPFRNLERNRELKEAGAYSPMDWYAMYPNMYVGDASKASAEKGKAMCEHRASALAKLIRAVKDDDVTEELMEQFALGVKEPQSPY